MENSKSIAKMDEFYIAAKTGTSRKPNSSGTGYSNKLYTSMIGYFPATDPRAALEARNYQHYLIIAYSHGAAKMCSYITCSINNYSNEQTKMFLYIQWH